MAKPLQSPFLHLSLTVSTSPHLLLTSAMVMLSDHCCLLVIPKIVLMHLRWNVFSRFSCRLHGIQHSALYSRTGRTNALCTLFLVTSFRSLSRKTAFRSVPKAFDACVTFLLTFASILPELVTKDHRYGNSSTAFTSPLSSTMVARSSSQHNYALTILWSVLQFPHRFMHTSWHIVQCSFLIIT